MAELPGVIVLVGGARVAWFANPEQAEIWARDNHFGLWLITDYTIPNKPLFTKEQVEAAKSRADELRKKIVWE